MRSHFCVFYVELGVDDDDSEEVEEDSDVAGLYKPMRVARCNKCSNCLTVGISIILP